MAYKVIYADPIALNVDEEGVYMEFMCDNATELAALPTEGSLYGGPRPGSLALCLSDESSRKAFYVLSTARTWVFLKEVT